jgi:hypothetical protein
MSFDRSLHGNGALLRGPKGVSHDELERIVELVAERQSRRDRLAIKVGERFLLVQSDDVISRQWPTRALL